MYNGYNYYPPNGSNATSPVYLMPYNPYQYDPFFMTPSGLQPVDGEENAEDKTESDGAKENNHQAENQNVSLNVLFIAISASYVRGYKFCEDSWT